MSFDRNRPIDRDAAERLLDGVHGDASPVGTVLTAAGAPAQRAELCGEDAAAAMFRVAFAIDAIRSHRRGPANRRSWTAGLVSARFAGAVLVSMLSMAGVAVAATTGLLPVLPHHHHSVPTGRTTDPGVTNRPTATAAVPTPTVSQAPAPTPTPNGATTTPIGSPSGSSAGSLRGSCHAYAAAVKNGRSVATDPAMTQLIDAAGGLDRVAVYCQALLTVPSAAASPAATGGSHSTGKSSSRPTGKPALNATGKPATSPHGKAAKPHTS
jgi:hypothetical protein